MVATFKKYMAGKPWPLWAQSLIAVVLVAVPLSALVYWLDREMDRPVTLLLLGSDRRRDTGPSRSDSILLLRAEPGSGILRGLSLPRDLYVELSGLPLTRKSDRLNSALFWGDYYAPGSGVEAARQTVSQLTGLAIEGSIVVRFSALKKFVNAIGGVEIYFEKPLYDKAFNSLTGETSYRLRFESGWNYLDGRRALEFVRIRKPDTDFGRMSRNRQLIGTTLLRLHEPKAWLGLGLAAPALLDDLQIELSILDGLRLARAVRRNALRGVEWTAIRRDQVVNMVTPRGARVLVPRPGVLRESGQALLGNPRVHARTARTQYF